MVTQTDFDTDAGVSFFCNFPDTILNLVKQRYGNPAFEELLHERESVKQTLPVFLRALARYSADPGIKSAIDHEYREYRRALPVALKKPKKSNLFFDGLDEKSRQILFALSTTGHATLDELSEAAHATHFEVLQRLREVINPESEQRFGVPFASFNESRTDVLTGERILFSWWLNDEYREDAGQVEVAEEEKDIFITAELPGSDLPRRMRASATFNHGILAVRVIKGGKPHERRSKRTG